jgi:DNA replication regulator DPB11
VTKAVTLMGTGIRFPTRCCSDKLIGAVYDELLSAKTSVIVCNTSKPAQPKMKFAADRQIPAVHAAWLEDSLSRGELLPYDAYMLNKPAQPVAHPQKPRQNANPQAAPSEKPIGSSRGEENPQTHQKKTHEPNMITKLKGIPQPRALDMALPDVMSVATDAFAHQSDITSFSDAARDDHSLAGFDGDFALPLQDRTSPGPYARTNGRERSSSAESLIRAAPAAHRPSPAKEATSFAMPQRPPEKAAGQSEKDYSDMLAAMRANRKPALTSTDQADEKRRRRRQLGRATSTRSNPSAEDGSGGNLDLEEDAGDENSVLVPEYQPSQELAWDSPGAAKARETMIRKLGGTVQERSVPAEGIGVVKDAAGSGVGGRASRRRG